MATPSLEEIKRDESAASAFQARFTAIQDELRRSLEKERVLISKCRELGVSVVGKARLLEVAFGTSRSDSTTIHELQNAILEAERVCELERMRGERVRKQIRQSKDAALHAGAEVARLTEVVERLRQQLAEKPRHTRPQLPRGPGQGATPFERWRSDRHGSPPIEGPAPRRCLSSGKLHSLGHIGPGEVAGSTQHALSCGCDGQEAPGQHQGHHRLPSDVALAAAPPPSTIQLVSHPFFPSHVYDDGIAASAFAPASGYAAAAIPRPPSRSGAAVVMLHPRPLAPSAAASVSASGYATPSSVEFQHITTSVADTIREARARLSGDAAAHHGLMEREMRRIQQREVAVMTAARQCHGSRQSPAR